MGTGPVRLHDAAVGGLRPTFGDSVFHLLQVGSLGGGLGPQVVTHRSAPGPPRVPTAF
jgi:hypothetical protein